MQTEEFIKKVRVRAGLDDNEQAKKSIDSVFDALRARISHEGGDNVASQLPKELKEMWEAGLMEHLKRAVTGFERMDLGGFLAKVADEAGLQDIGQSETVTRAVFRTLQEQITPGASKAIENQLPPDIRDFWVSSAPQAEETTETPTVFVTEEVRTEMLIIGMPGSMTEYDEESEVAESNLRPDMPSGYDVDMTIAMTEAQVRDMTQKGQEPYGAQRLGEVTEGSKEVQPPSVDRIQMTTPPQSRGTAGPGSEIYYRSDPQLSQEIEHMLDEDEDLKAENIDVFVQAGNVTLRGKVKSNNQRESAGRVAAKALGVGEIRNELIVMEQNQP